MIGDLMSKFILNYSCLDDALNKKIYRLNDVKDKIEKVAFDIVRFKDNDKGAELWQIQKAEDGDYIVAMYQAEEDKVANNWNVSLSKLGNNLQISYKGDPFIRISSTKLGIPPSELSKIEQYLPKKLAENKKLVKALLNELNESAKKEVLNKYPELV
jgi:hypothetical protein